MPSGDDRPLTPRDQLRSLFDRAVAVADPMRSLAAYLPERPKGRIVVVGAGKASARMAEAVEAHWGPCEGLVITRYGYGRVLSRIELAEAAHPVPDAAGELATARMLNLLTGLTEKDFVLALISGGASALLVAPAKGMTLADKQEVNDALLASGAPISQMNIVRKHLSRVKGGQLAAAAWPAPVLALALSDVPGDDPGSIGSGPTVGDDSTVETVRQIFARHNINPAPVVRAALDAGSTCLRPDDPKLSHTETRVFAAPSQSLAAAAELAQSWGFEVQILGDRIEGEARDVAAQHAELALRERQQRPEDARPLLILSGGELTVTRKGDGVGGPNAEYALALAVALNGAGGIHALACDTDGVDGAAEVAGAVIAPDTLARAARLGLLPADHLLRNDAHSFFGRLGDQIVTGPTLTNVNDFRAIIVTGARD